MSLQQKAWETLSTINVNDKTETKGKGQYALTYLSWAWAWGVLMKHFPQSTYLIHEDRLLPDGSVIVGVTLTIKDGEEEFSRYMWLPVMDYSNRAIKNPDAMAINKAYMRCLAKAIAMCGLGHYIYAGEDLPNEEDSKETPKPKLPPNSNSSTKQNMSSTQPKKTPEETLQGFIQAVQKAQSREDVEKYWQSINQRLTNYPQLLSTARDHYDARIGDFDLAEM